jgi:hypothetical protein
MPDAWESYYGSNPNDPSDATVDSDHDGYTNIDEYRKGTDPNNAQDSPADYIDSDHDGMPDAWEIYYGLDPYDPTDADEDADQDGHSNLDEYLQGTNPTDQGDPARRPSQDAGEEDKGAIGLGYIHGIDLAYIYIIISSVAIAVIILSVILYRRRTSVEPTLPPQPLPYGVPTYYCYYCGYQLVYISEHFRWYCNTCNRYVT